MTTRYDRWRRILVSFIVGTIGLGAAIAPAIAAQVSSPSVSLYRYDRDGARQIKDHFAPSDKIYAEVRFIPSQRRQNIDFRWINPKNKQEQNYSEWVQTAPDDLGKPRSIVGWLQLHTSVFEKALGSPYVGVWRLEIWLDGRKSLEKGFQVSQ